MKYEVMQTSDATIATTAFIVFPLFIKAHAITLQNIKIIGGIAGIAANGEGPESWNKTAINAKTDKNGRIRIFIAVQITPRIIIAILRFSIASK